MSESPSPFADEISFKYATPGEMLAVCTVLPVLSIAVVALRFYARRIQRAEIGIDDWLILPGLVYASTHALDDRGLNLLQIKVLFSGMAVALIIGVEQRAVAYPTPPPSNPSMDALLTENPDKSKVVQEIEFAMQLLSSAAYGFIKLSIVFFCRRLFNVSKRSIFNILTTCLMVAIVLWSVGFFLGFVFGCGAHVAANWGPREDLLEYCTRRLNFYNGYLVSDVILDLIILVVPLPVIWSLQMGLSRKIAVSGVMLVGSVAVAASIARLVLNFEVTNHGYAVAVDEDLTISTILYWYTIEAGTALIAACLPSLRCFFANKSLQSIMNSIRSLISLRSTSLRGNDYYTDVESNHSVGDAPQTYGQNGIRTKTSIVGGASKDMELRPLPQVAHIQVEHGFELTHNEA